MEHTVDKGWPAVDLIGVGTYEEHRWQEFVAAGGDDSSATFEGGRGLIHHPLTYDTEMVGNWTSRQKRKRGRPAKRELRAEPKKWTKKKSICRQHTDVEQRNS